MGATQSTTCGFGVLNKSTIHEIHIGLSMQATHYYENGVKQNEIFYRWPSLYTVYAYAPDGVVSGAGALSIAYGAYKDATAATRARGLAFENSLLYCGCNIHYGVGSGSWLVVEGGPYMDKHGRFQPRDLSIRAATKKEVANGVFTEVSHEKFHTCEGLQCTRRCPYCKK